MYQLILSHLDQELDASKGLGAHYKIAMVVQGMAGNGRLVLVHILNLGGQARYKPYCNPTL